MIRIAWFVSPHGFGHAARSAAIMDEVFRVRSDVTFDIFTTVPRWFFEASLSMPIQYHHCRCDLGLVQQSALEEDIEATSKQLDDLDLLKPSKVRSLADTVERLGCRAVVADISPQGLAVGRMAGIPSILVENFTWDWIYRAYEDRWPSMSMWADVFEAEFSRCDLHIQAEPWCRLVNGAVRVAPISRRPRKGRDEIRRDLGVDGDQPMLLVSMGGVPWHFSGLDKVAAATGVKIIVPGGGETEATKGSLILLPHHSRFHHPDLVHAANGVLAKLGYSTVAEVWSADCAIGWVGRPTFPESEILAEWVRGHLAGAEFSREELVEGLWVDRLGEIIDATTPPDDRPSGALAAAEALITLIESSVGD